jgi:fatty aldehyde-generating acyl-ACP reductase
MDTFAFIIHPIDPKRDVSRKYPLLGRALTEQQINFFSTFFPPVYISEIEGITSVATGKEIRGWFVACPLTPARMLELPVETVYRKIIATGQLAERLGAQILGLGAFTSVVGDGGLSVAEALDVPVTSGDALTVAMAIEAVTQAAEVMDIPPANASAAVIGATGSIGKVCAEILAEQVGRVILIGRRVDALAEHKAHLESAGLSAVIEMDTSTDRLREAQLIVSVTNNLDAVIQPELLQPGSVICDVARPRDVSASVVAQRQDVLVIDGGMVEVPGSVDFHFDFGFPPGKAYACMAETMALALEGRFEDYTLGKEITRSRVAEIAEIASRHGFRLSGFRSFERAVTEEYIAGVRRSVRAQIKAQVAPAFFPR